MGGDGLESDDDVTITGYGEYGGDAQLSDGKTGGNDTFTINSTSTFSSTSVVGDFTAASSNLTTTGGDDTMVDNTATGSGRITFIGDFSYSSAATVTIGGDDTLTVNLRKGVLIGDMRSVGAGEDLTGGNDTLTGGDLDDRLYGEFRYGGNSGTPGSVIGGDDVLYGGDGDDLLYGEGFVGPGNISLTGGNDSLYGGSGADSLYGDSGNDELYGGDDDDMMFGGSGTDTFYGGLGKDTVSFADSFFALTVNYTGGGAGNLVNAGITENMQGVESVIGTTLGDTFTGDAASQTFNGGAGNDTMNGNGGTDYASYSDATSGITVDLSISGISQNVGGGQGFDTLTNMEGIIGSDYDDTLFGSSVNDVIYGGDGNDTILLRSGTSGFPSPGSDTIYGGDGADIIGFALDGIGQSNLDDGHMLYGGYNLSISEGDTFAFETYTSAYQIILDSSGDGQFVQIATGNVIAGLDDFEHVIAGNGDDIITLGSNRYHTVHGNGGSDTIITSSGQDGISGVLEMTASTVTAGTTASMAAQAWTACLEGHQTISCMAVTTATF